MTDSNMPEPVAWRRMNADRTQSTGVTDVKHYADLWRKEGGDVRPLYTHPSHVADAELEALIEDLERGVRDCGMHEDNSTELYDVDGANEVMAQAATALRARTAQPVGLDHKEVAGWFDKIANHTAAQSPRHMAMNYRDRILSVLLPEGGE